MAGKKGSPEQKKSERTRKARRASAVLLDTSVLVAAVVESHEHHGLAFPWMQRIHAGEVRGLIAAHGVAETFAVLTRLPQSLGMRPDDALQIIESFLPRFQIVGLAGRDYVTVIQKLAGAGLSGGIIYDALHFQAAVKVGASRVVTVNRRDFSRLSSLFGITVEYLLPL